MVRKTSLKYDTYEVWNNWKVLTKPLELITVLRIIIYNDNSSKSESIKNLSQDRIIW